MVFQNTYKLPDTTFGIEGEEESLKIENFLKLLPMDGIEYTAFLVGSAGEGWTLNVECLLNFLISSLGGCYFPVYRSLLGRFRIFI